MSNQGFPAASASKAGNLIVNPSGVNPGLLETYIRCPGWWALGMSPLWDYPDERGQNSIIAGVNGQAINPLRLDQGIYVLEMRFTGSADASGNAPSGTADTRFLRQLHTNLDRFWQNVGKPPASGMTRAAKLILPDASTLTDNVQFKFRTGTMKGAEMLAALTVIVPGYNRSDGGRFGGS